MIDPVGDEMKTWERSARVTLPAKSFLVIRCDGRSFSKFTAGLNRPFDARLAADMLATTQALCEEVSGPLFGFTQSDELSIVASDMGSQHAEHWFGGEVTKVVSSAASFVTAVFNDLRGGLDNRPAMFDARAFTLPDVAAVERYLSWRQADARRNAVSMLCHEFLGHRAVQGVPTRERLVLLAAAGVDIDAYDLGFVHGRFVYPHVERGDVAFTDRRTGERSFVRDVERRVWRSGTAPLFEASDVIAELVASSWSFAARKHAAV